jgi:hypothetical protein
MNESIAREILEQVACQHPGCGRPLTECDGRSHMAQSARHQTLCPLCGGTAHNNDAKSTMAFRCAMRQALAEHGEKFDDKSDILQADQMRKLADWLETPGREYGKEAAARALIAAGTRGIAAAKLGKRAAAGMTVPPPPTPSAAPAPTVPPPPTPVVRASVLACVVCGNDPAPPCEYCPTPVCETSACQVAHADAAHSVFVATIEEPPTPPAPRPVVAVDEDFEEIDEVEVERMRQRLERLNA